MMTLVYYFIDRGRGADECVTCGVGALDVARHAIYHAIREDTPGRANPANQQNYSVTVIDGKAHVGTPIERHFSSRSKTTRRKRK